MTLEHTTAIRFTLRDANTGDAESIVQVLHAAFQQYETLLDPPSGVHKETAESIREKFESAEWMVTEADGQTVGCVMCEPRGDYVCLGRLGVLPAWRGVGIGGALIDRVETRAREMGIFRVRLGVRLVLTDMRESYERRGYRIIEYATHPGYKSPTFVTMEKPLSDVTY